MLRKIIFVSLHIKPRGGPSEKFRQELTEIKTVKNEIVHKTFDNREEDS